MSRKLALVFIAIGVAAAVLALTLVGGGRPPSDPARTQLPLPPDVATDAPPVPELTAQQLRTTPERPETAPPTTGQYHVERRTRGRLWQFWGQRVTPLQQGLIRVDQPGMRVHLAPSRVLQITARSGTFVAPDNQPRSGDFESDVVVTLFETRDGSRPVLSENSPDIQLRLFLDDAAFDVDLGQIDSVGPVRLTGPSVDFTGRGLRINYNERRNRLERLEVMEGRELRLKPAALQEARRESPTLSEPGTAPPMTEDKDAEPAPPPRQRRQRAAAADDQADPDATGTDLADLTPAERRRQRAEAREAREAAQEATFHSGPQFYRAVFHDDVTITHPAATATADTLQLVFSMDEDPSPPGAGTQAARGMSPTGALPTGGPASMWVQLLTLRYAVTDTAASTPLFHPAADDLIVHWSGRLVVQPEESAPAGVTGPSDQLLTLTGSPVRIDTPDAESVTAAAVDYYVRSERVDVFGSDASPLRVVAPSLGTLTGRRLSVDSSKRTGYVEGPGTLDAARADDAARAGEAASLAGLRIAWSRRLDLTFFPAAGEHDSATLKIESATFHGDVVADHPQFDLRSQQLAVAFAPPTPAQDEPQLRQIDAAGDVTLSARPADDDVDAPSALHLQSQQMTIALAGGADGRTTPTGLTATGATKITLPTQSLWAEEVHVGLSTSAAEKIDVTTLQARRDVRVEMQEAGGGGIAALAHALDADARTGRAELLGRGGAMARLIREDGELAGHRILLSEQAGQAHVPGAGTLTFVARRHADRPPTHLNIAWTEAMRFDDEAGAATFAGDVVAATASGRDRTRLTSRELRVEFGPVGSDQPDVTSVGNVLGGQREIRRITAASPGGEAVFLATVFRDPADAVDNPVVETDENMTNRFRLAGPSIVFETATERVVVTGPGTMLVEDYAQSPAEAQGDPPATEVAGSARGVPTADDSAGGPPMPSSQAQARAPRPSPPRQPAALLGKGQTVFRWTGSLVLDAASNDMIIRDDVLMIHRTPSRAGVVQINCDRLVADQAVSEGGLNAWLAGDAPTPEVQTVRADGSVRIREGTATIVADHAHYDNRPDSRTRGYVDIFSDEGVVTVQDDNEPLGQLTARKLRWHLEDNRFEVIQPGPTRVPMGVTPARRRAP